MRRWRLRLEPGDFSGCRTYRHVLEVLYGRWRAGRASASGGTDPHYVTDIPVLLRIFPEAKVLHIYRDGRDVALSWVGPQVGPGNVFGAATAWRRLVRTGRRDEGSWSRSYREICFEDSWRGPRTP